MGSESFDRLHERERDRRRREAKEAAQRRLIGKAERIAGATIERIASEYRPKEIYQTGSLLDPNRFSEISDIDIAVSGLTPEEIEEISDWTADESAFPVDIIDLDRAEQVYRKEIYEKGRRVFPQ